MTKAIRWLKKAGPWCFVLTFLSLAGAGIIAPKWTWNVLVSTDQFVNTLLGGDPDETISSRMGKWMSYETDLVRRQIAKPVCWVLDIFDSGHCSSSIEEDEGKKATIK